MIVTSRAYDTTNPKCRPPLTSAQKMQSPLYITPLNIGSVYLLLLGLKFFDPPCCVVPFPRPWFLVTVPLVGIPLAFFHSSLPDRLGPDVDGFVSPASTPSAHVFYITDEEKKN
jgi:hypothetical protein